MWKALILVIFIAGCSYTTGQYTSSRETYVEQQPEAREPTTDEAGESEIGKYSADSNSESSTNLEVQDNDSSQTQFIRVQDEQIPEIVEVASDVSAPNQIDVGVSGSTQIDVNGVPVTAHDANPAELTAAQQVPEALPQPELLVRHPLHYIPQQQQQPSEAQALQLRVLDAGQPAAYQQQQQQPQAVLYQQQQQQQPQAVVYQHQQPIASSPETTVANSGEVHVVNGNQATIRALHDTLVNRVLAKQQQAIQQQTIAQVQTTANVQQQAQPVAVAKSLQQSRTKPVRKSGRGGYAAVIQPKPVLTSPVNSVMATQDLQIVRTSLGLDYQQQQQPQIQPVYNSVSPSATPISADQLNQLQNAGYEIVRFQQPQSKVLVQQSILTPETYDETPGNPQPTVIQTLAGPTTTELMSQIGYTAVQDTPRYTVYKVKDTSDPEQNSVSTSRLQYVGQQNQGYQQQQQQQQQQHYQQTQVSAAKSKEYQEIQARQRNREQEQLQQQNQQQEQLQQDQLQQAQLKQQQQQILRKQAKLRQQQQQSQQQAQLQQRNLIQQQRDIEQQQRDLQLRLHHKQQVQQKLQLQQQQQQLARSKIDFINPHEQSGQVTFNTPYAPTGVKQQVVYKSSVDPDYYNAVKAKLMHTFAQMNYLHQAYPYFNPYASPFGPRPDVGLQFNPYARGHLFGQPQLPYRPDFNPYYRPELLSARPDPFRGAPYPPRQNVPAEPLHTAGSKIISELPPLLKAASLGNKLSGIPPPPKHALESPLFSSKTVDVEYAPGVDLGFDEAAYAAEQARRLGGPAFIDPGHIQPSIGFKLNEETAKFEQLPPTREIYKYQHKEFLDLQLGTKISSPPPPPPPVPTSAAPVPVPRPVYRENPEAAPVPRPSYHAHPEPVLPQPKFNSVPYLNNLPNPSNSPNFGRYSPLNININGSPYPHHHQPQINPGRVEVNAIDPEQKPALPHHLLAQLLRATTGEELELEQY